MRWQPITPGALLRVKILAVSSLTIHLMKGRERLQRIRQVIIKTAQLLELLNPHGLQGNSEGH